MFGTPRTGVQAQACAPTRERRRAPVRRRTRRTCRTAPVVARLAAVRGMAHTPHVPHARALFFIFSKKEKRG